MSGLSAVVRELEQRAAGAGWDRPPQLFALVPTAELLAREPGLADQLASSGELTPVQQERVPADGLERFLHQLAWPDSVAGCAVVMERLVLPPGADADIPDDPAEATRFAAAHPDRQDVRIVASVTRDGESACAMRLRSHDQDESVLVGPDLVPELVELLLVTLQPDTGENDDE